MGIVLKVMSGDKVAIAAESYYNMPGSGPGTVTTLPLNQLLGSLVSSAVISAAKGALHPGQVSLLGNNADFLKDFLKTNEAPNSTYAGAHLNWILFDE